MIPHLKPKIPPKAVVVVYIGSKYDEKGTRAAKTRMRKVSDERHRLSSSARAIIDTRLAEGLRDIEQGRELGPFSNVQDLIRALESKR